MSSDFMTWNVNGITIEAPAGLLPEGILGDQADVKAEAARRFDQRQAGRERDQMRREGGRLPARIDRRRASRERFQRRELREI
jgi:hypothetical protein